MKRSILLATSTLLAILVISGSNLAYAGKATIALPGASGQLNVQPGDVRPPGDISPPAAISSPGEISPPFIRPPGDISPPAAVSSPGEIAPPFVRP
jgi:hypothetical protein